MTKTLPVFQPLLVLASPHASWGNVLDGSNGVVRWAAAASAVPYTEEVGWSVIDALLQISSVDSLRSHVPVDIWKWLCKRAPLPHASRGREVGAQMNVIHHVRGLEMLKSSRHTFFSSGRSGSSVEIPVLFRPRSPSKRTLAEPGWSATAKNSLNDWTAFWRNRIERWNASGNIGRYSSETMRTLQGTSTSR